MFFVFKKSFYNFVRLTCIINHSILTGATHQMNFRNLNKDAIFSDETTQYLTPNNPNPGDTIQFKLRISANTNCCVCLHLGETPYPMQLSHSTAVFDYYTTTAQTPLSPTRYYYSIKYEGTQFFYNKRGLWENLVDHYNFRLVPGISTPNWAKGAIMYQIFVDRFHNGDPTNDVINHEYSYLNITAKSLPWEKEIAAGDFCNFYGGDLQGIMDKMEYLQGLGVEVIYLNPIFVSPSSHKYDAQDYDYVDPHFGKIVEDGGDVLRFEKVDNKFATRYKKRTTSFANLEASNALMVDFIKKAHELGMKVILDGVFNHCGCYHKWMDKAGFYDKTGAYYTKDSPYRDYFVWNGDQYAGWWDNLNHPKLNFEDSPELFDYILEVGKKWVSPPYNADGWRLDVAADLGRSAEMNHFFWQKFHHAVKTANPNAIILAEHYGDPSHWLNGNEWDTIMNYDAFMEPITWFLTGVSKHSEESRPYLKGDAAAFEGAMRHHMAYLNIHALQTAMNQLSNHDHSRFLTRTNGNIGRWHTVGHHAAGVGVNKNIMMAAVVFQMTWPGAPTIYYGDEAGLAGWTDPDNRRTFPWGKEDAVLTNLHKSLARMRKKYPMLRTGSMEFLHCEYGLISYGRWDESQKIIVVINNKDRHGEVYIPVWKAEIFDGQLTALVATGSDTFHEPNTPHTVNGGELKLSMPPYSAIVLGTITVIDIGV